MEGEKAKGYHAKFRKLRPALVILLLALTTVAGMLISRVVLHKSLNDMGQNLVQNYMRDEERSMGVYENIVKLGMSYINDWAGEDASEEKIEAWINDYFKEASGIIKGDILDLYAVVDGKILASRSSKGIESYNFFEEPWYEMAKAADGKVIFTDAYEDSIHKCQVVTIAMANPSTGNAVAFDIIPEVFHKSHQNLQLPEDSSYYVCDSAGEVLYYNAADKDSPKTITAYAKELYEKIHSGEINEDDNAIEDLDGRKQGLYYYEASNGWTCILTIPYTTLYGRLHGAYTWFMGIIIFLIVVIGGFWIYDVKIKRNMRRANEAVHVLGSSYFAIYRINVKNGNYEMIKDSDYVKQKLPDKGAYKNLLDCLHGNIDKEMREDFLEKFSLENIVRLAKNENMDFGGNFLYQFGDACQWVNVRVIRDSEVISEEVVLCFRNVDEEKRRENQQLDLMKDLLAAADASEKSQKQFFSNMSHDMRTPLNAIIGMADLALRKHCSPEKMEDYFQKISLSSKQLLALINDILEMSRLEQGRVNLDSNTFNICDALLLCATPFKNQAQKEGKNVEIEVDVSSPMVCGDYYRLTQILNSLLSNAVKYTGEGDQITVFLRQVENRKQVRYLFIIEDTGVGISEKLLPKLFEPYQIEDRFGAQNVMGIDLSMPIVKNLVSWMGGEISVDSKLGEGTRYIITLPFAVISTEPEPENEDQEFGGLKGKRILLAEDNPLNMEIVMELLNCQGVEVTSAENGREALDTFSESEEHYFDAILMDMQMPEMDGCESARSIRALDRSDAASVPIIALTANTFAEDIARTAKARMNAHLSKPVEPDLLFATLEQMISERASG